MEFSREIVVLACANAERRQRLCHSLEGRRWQVLEAAGGAEAMALLEEHAAKALLLDSWLPDLEAGAFAEVVQQLYPQIDLLRLDGETTSLSLRHPRKHELLHAIREAGTRRGFDGAIWNAGHPGMKAEMDLFTDKISFLPQLRSDESQPGSLHGTQPGTVASGKVTLLPGMVGESAAMYALARLVRLVAPHSARVLIEGETGSGKELVARAVHNLSGREAKPFVALNCAAIPEALLEAELFGHTRGAFTGAVQSRQGRIEAAHGGTLFLDEIGELPLALQAKLLRFLENGELQRIGGNDVTHVDVRVVSATHQNLEERAEKGSFRLDLYHRLAVFPVQVPSLRERIEDLSMLVAYILEGFRQQTPPKFLSALALHHLAKHSWPGNVRELQNVLHRAVILSEARPEIRIEDLQFGRLRQL